MRQELLLLPFLPPGICVYFKCLTDCSVLRTPTILPNIRIPCSLHCTLCSFWGGSLNHRTTPVQAHRGSWFMTLAFEILRLIKNFKIKNMVYFIY